MDGRMQRHVSVLGNVQFHGRNKKMNEYFIWDVGRYCRIKLLLENSIRKSDILNVCSG